MHRFLLLVSLLIITASAWAHASYTGYSGAPGRQTCASSCHGSGTGTVTVSGFPAQYTPGQVYTVSIGHTSGSTIANFNASCRVGSGSTNAGTITSGISTVTYNVSGENNGVHFNSIGQNSGTFNWTAPAAGTGIVHLYVGAHQGTYSGTNNTFDLTADEATTVPGQATNPYPSDGDDSATPGDSVSWTAGAGTALNIIYFGESNPPDSVMASGAPVFYQAHTLPGRTYYWRIDEQNDAGITAGQVWQFSTATNPASNPEPADGDTLVAVGTTLSWQADSATTYNVYFGTVNPPPLVSPSQSGTSYYPPQNLAQGTVYYWRVDVIYPARTHEGSVWSFRTESASTAGDHPSLVPAELGLGPVYPNPFNATVTIPFALPQAANVTVSLYDVTGRLVAIMASGNYAAGTHALQWSSQGVGSGVYLVRLTAANRTLTTKVVALK